VVLKEGLDVTGVGHPQCGYGKKEKKIRLRGERDLNNRFGTQGQKADNYFNKNLNLLIDK